MKPKPLANRKALLLLASWFAVALSARLSGADAASGAPEEAWKQLVAARQEFYALQPSSFKPQDFERFLAEGGQKAGQLADRYKDYQQSHTNSTHLSDAWSEWMHLLIIAAHSSPARKTELDQAEQQCLADPKLERSRRETIRSNQVKRTRDLKQRERLVREVKDDFESPAVFLCENLIVIADFSDYPHARELVAEVLKLSADQAELKRFRLSAQDLSAKLDRIGHPLRLKFTALDGSEVDLEKLRGKVVLLEFWATWCPPCVAGIPQIKSAWDALHREGFEVIALSYDTERERLEKFVKREALPWPQFFAPEGDEAPLIKSLGQPSPPSYWLLNREGVLVDINANQELERKVKSLLAPGSSGSADSAAAQGAVQNATAPGGPTNQSQPFRTQTNQASQAAGSGR